MTDKKFSRLWGGKKGNKGATDVMCGFCRQPIVMDKTHSGKFYSVSAMEGLAAQREQEGDEKIHSECWEAYHDHTAPKCLHCQGPVAHLPGRYDGKYYRSDDPPGQVHNECWEAFNATKPPKEKCSQCGESLSSIDGKFSGSFVQLDGGPKLHVECRAKYHEKNTKKCLQCKAPVAPEKGKFSGEFYEVEGKGRVHSECFEEYSDATAEKCIVCKEGIRRKGRFSGDFGIFDAGKVHKECASDYQEMIAYKCLHCGKGVRKTGSFSGSYYPVERKTAGDGDDEAKEEGGENTKEDRVHLECWPAYEAKLAGDREAAAAKA